MGSLNLSEIASLSASDLSVTLCVTLWAPCLLSLFMLLSRCEKQEKMFCTGLKTLFYKCPSRDFLIILSDFSATTGTERTGYELCMGPHGSGTINTNSSFRLDFARFRKLRSAGIREKSCIGGLGTKVPE